MTGMIIFFSVMISIWIGELIGFVISVRYIKELEEENRTLRKELKQEVQNESLSV